MFVLGFIGGVLAMYLWSYARVSQHLEDAEGYLEQAESYNKKADRTLDEARTLNEKTIELGRQLQRLTAEAEDEGESIQKTV
jgi:F0F1-type ATP synthase membrane subunit b/b'